MPQKPSDHSVSCSRITSEILRGVWPALITPWNLDDTVDESRLAEEIRHMAEVGVHGTYTGGTAGEFYAQDDDLFRRITAVACREAHRRDLPIQIGCTALSTRIVRRRIEIAIDHGADAIQLALPFWLPLTDDEVFDFFCDVATCAGSIPLVFYQTPRAKRRVDPPLLGNLVKAVPTLIGIKDTGADWATLSSIIGDSPQLAVFGTDIDLLERMQLGACGTYSSVAGLNAELMLAIYYHAAYKRYELAEPLQDAVRRLMEQVLHPMGQEFGLMDSAIDRVQRVAGGGNVGLRCQAPYRCAADDHVSRVREWCRREAPILLERDFNLGSLRNAVV
jgi:dihydrodipicolinate synthase/N-acetylneuraminate lyase